MGYYTQYNLELSDYSQQEEVVSALAELNVIDYALDHNLECCDSVKWYSHDDAMTKVSLKFPDILFTLNGEGEESGDIWVTYYKKG